jgi:hypothetical protein
MTLPARDCNIKLAAHVMMLAVLNDYLRGFLAIQGARNSRNGRPM